MTNVVWNFITRVRREARCKPEVVCVRALGSARTFLAYDWGCDTFVFEKGVWALLSRAERDPILIVRKAALVPGAPGYIFTLTKGNHSVAALPLLNGQFWNLGRVPQKKRGTLLQREIVCGNIVGDTFELSQRDVPETKLIDGDAWLQTLGVPIDTIVMAERTASTLAYYRRQGQEWRIRPLAWTRQEMDLALRSSRSRLTTRLQFYHSARGVHFLSYRDFHQLADWVTTDYADFLAGIRELVAVPEGQRASNTRLEKFHGHHEIELFGMRPGTAEAALLPQMENLLEGITLNRLGTADVVAGIRRIDDLFRRSLDAPQLADDASDAFVETMYRHLTGEVYLGTPDEVVSAFDDRRTALPGATYRGGRPDIHTLTDSRSRAILEYLQSGLSHGETIEHVNIYEVRVKVAQALGLGETREIVYKTNRMPIPMRLIEKRLAHTMPGYGSYMLARVAAYKSLGMDLCTYHMLARHDAHSDRDVNYFIRNRCQGDPFGTIPRSRFLMPADEGGSEGIENPDTILAVAALMGSAAAQTLVMKRYLPEKRSCRFGEGKEIIEFGYDVNMLREMPIRVLFCSIRGAMGWPSTEWSNANLTELFDFYVGRFAEVVVAFWKEHQAFISLSDIGERFFNGFASKTREMHWIYVRRREQFDAFDPELRKVYNFKGKWAFTLWSLERQSRRMDVLKELLMERIGTLQAAQTGAPSPGVQGLTAPTAPTTPLVDDWKIDLLNGNGI